MSYEKASLVSSNLFIKEFTKRIIKSIKDKDFSNEERLFIDSSLVPNISEEVMMKSSPQKTISIEKVVPKRINEIKRVIQLPKKVKPKTINLPRAPPRNLFKPIQAQVPLPPLINSKSRIQGYGKIELLLNDPSVFMIESQGPGKPIMIVRMGQRQSTKIILSRGEIEEVLEEVSKRSHIPLLEGVFRAAVDNFSINAIVSDAVGSKFIIKKQFLRKN